MATSLAKGVSFYLVSMVSFVRRQRESLAGMGGIYLHHLANGIINSCNQCMKRRRWKRLRDTCSGGWPLMMEEGKENIDVEVYIDMKVDVGW